MEKLTIKKLKELLKSGDDVILVDTSDESGLQYLLQNEGDTFKAVKRQWEPNHPAAWVSWVELAIISDIKPQDVNNMDIIKELDESHQEWLDELEEADVYFNK